VNAVALAARQVLHPLLLIGALEVEAREVCTGRDDAPPDVELVEPARDLLEDGLLPLERIATLVHVGQLHVLADAELARVRLLRAGDHPEERGLARAVRSDDSNDAAGRQLEVQILDEKPVAVGLPHASRLHHEAGELGPRRDGDLAGEVALVGAGGLRCS
jgi:hypothetical protein